MSIGPTISGIYLGFFKVNGEGVRQNYTSPIAYDLIFLTAALISVGGIFLALLITPENKKLMLKI